MRVTERRARLAAAMLCACAAAAPAAAQVAAPGAGPSFYVVRYASRSSLAMYTGYRAGPVLFVAGMLHNPRTAYREMMAGVGRPVGLGGGSSLMVATAGAYTNTGWYGQLYLLPTLRWRRLTLDGTAELAQPLRRTGTRGMYVSPGNLLLDVGGGFALGAAYYGSYEAGSPASHGAGPALQRAVPRGSITLELVRGLAAARDEMRFTMRASF